MVRLISTAATAARFPFAGLLAVVGVVAATALALLAAVGGCARDSPGGVEVAGVPPPGAARSAPTPGAAGGAAGQPPNFATFPPSAPAARAGGSARLPAAAPPAAGVGVAPSAAGGFATAALGGPAVGAAGAAAPPGRPAGARPAGYVGVILARQAVTVAAEAEGRLASVSVRVGDVVRRGQELAALSTEALHDEMAVVQATVSAARSEQRRAELELDRTRDRRARRELHPELYAEEDLASARNAEQEAAASVGSAKARVAEEVGHLRQLETRLQHTVLRSPIDGRVALRYLDGGAQVHSGEPVVRLISANEFLLRFAVPPERAAGIRKGAGVEVRLDSLPLTLAGRVSQVAPRIDTASQMVFVEAELQVPPSLLNRLQDGLPGRVIVAG
jgi:RND family efflux transporter MFP subunit